MSLRIPYVKEYVKSKYKKAAFWLSSVVSISSQELCFNQIWKTQDAEESF